MCSSDKMYPNKPFMAVQVSLLQKYGFFTCTENSGLACPWPSLTKKRFLLPCADKIRSLLSSTFHGFTNPYLLQFTMKIKVSKDLRRISIGPQKSYKSCYLKILKYLQYFEISKHLINFAWKVLEGTKFQIC